MTKVVGYMYTGGSSRCSQAQRYNLKQPAASFQTLVDNSHGVRVVAVRLRAALVLRMQPQLDVGIAGGQPVHARHIFCFNNVQVQHPCWHLQHQPVTLMS